MTTTQTAGRVFDKIIVRVTQEGRFWTVNAFGYDCGPRSIPKEDSEGERIEEEIVLTTENAALDAGCKLCQDYATRGLAKEIVPFRHGDMYGEQVYVPPYLFASDVREVIGSPDNETIADGYTFSVGDRGSHNVSLMFENGQLVRRDWSGRDDRELPFQEQRSNLFDPEFFFAGVRRYYEDKCNARLLALFKSFGRPLP